MCCLLVYCFFNPPPPPHTHTTPATTTTTSSRPCTPETPCPHCACLVNCSLQGLAVRPRAGDATIFWSLRPDGTFDYKSLHGSCPVLRGEKWSATKWCVGSWGGNAAYPCFLTVRLPQSVNHACQLPPFTSDTSLTKPAGSTLGTMLLGTAQLSRSSASYMPRHHHQCQSGVTTLAASVQCGPSLGSVK